MQRNSVVTESVITKTRYNVLTGYITDCWTLKKFVQFVHYLLNNLIIPKS